jgi:hypothetical protein
MPVRDAGARPGHPGPCWYRHCTNAVARIASILEENRVSNRLSILSNVNAADLVLEPYPHFVIQDALDPDVFVQLEAAYPADQMVVGERPIRDTWYDYPACKVLGDRAIAPLWREFFRYHTSAEFFRELATFSAARTK